MTTAPLARSRERPGECFTPWRAATERGSRRSKQSTGKDERGGGNQRCDHPRV